MWSFREIEQTIEIHSIIFIENIMSELFYEFRLILAHAKRVHLSYF